MAVTYEMVKTAALTLPAVTEGTSYGTPGLRVGKSLIARLREDGETLVLKIEPVERDILIEAQPECFYVTDHYRGYPWVLVRLANADLDHIALLLRRAWFSVAPKRLAKAMQEAGRGPV